ncbi:MULTISPECIES: TolC family protein [unclassified Tenacibaculum]|uniref:TolC family protein n=1 Tax=unclassified Tenacibaculum TaxID=2635139 RepID=UPI001F486640|nr:MULTISPECIES: TolC family protein [unclassified Tenacibaculum]MCF2876539.1 TolC family protein [Tenacibaculum sp. Cn5-1]MCF2936554.1 TolC family protein [Tenacibaculum sp. Cn5-34]MCG7511853.1 TolC family protein [Tenacibaculum sp. Cn5-46]
MKVYKIITVLIVLILFSVTIKAQDKFSLKEAINYAKEHNRNIIISQKDIEIALKRKWETTAEGLPQINANATYNYWLKQQLSLIPGVVAQQPDKDFVPIAFGTKHNANGTITIKQKVFDGSYLVALQSAKVFLEISKNQKEKSLTKIKEQVTLAFVNVLVAKKAIAITNQNINNLKKNLYETKEMLLNGLVEEENVEQLEITLGELQNNLISIEYQKEVAKDLLKVLIGKDINTSIQLTDNLEYLLSEYTSNTLNNSEIGLNNNIDFRIAQNKVKAKELQLKLEKSKALPSLDVSFQTAIAGYGNNLNATLRTTDMLTSNLFLVNLNIPIFSSFKRSASTKRKKIEVFQAKTALKETQQQLSLKLTQAKKAFDLAIKKLSTTKQNLDLSERIADKNQTKFNNGIASSFELRQAQTQLYATQQAYIQAIQNLISKKVELESLVNK